MKYKVGQQVKIIKDTDPNNFYSWSVGLTAEIIKINKRDSYPYYVKTSIERSLCVSEEEIKPLKGGETKTMAYLVAWETEDNDPWELVDNLDEATAKVEELLDDGVSENDIRVFEVKKELDIDVKGVELS